MEQGKDEGNDHTLVHNNQAGSPIALEDTQDNTRYGIRIISSWRKQWCGGGLTNVG